MGRLILFFLRSLAWGYYFLPWSGRRFLGSAVGWVLCQLRVRARIVEQNLGIAFPGDQPESVAERNRIFKEGYRHLGLLAFEILLLLGPLRRYRDRNCEIRGLENWRKALARGKGVLFLSSHVGNWELMAATGARAGIDLLIVTKHLKPEWLHQAIEEGRASCSVRGTYEPRTMKDILAQLKRGATVGFVLDQYAGPPIGVRVPFFGVPVGTATTIATLAKRTEAPVLPVLNYRTSEGRCVVEIQPALDWKTDPNSNRELAINTANYAAVLEGHVYSHPDQWLWIHRRFKGNLSPLTNGEWELGRARRS